MTSSSTDGLSKIGFSGRVWVFVQSLLFTRHTFHRDVRGIAAADVILVIAAVSIPLIIALVAFGDDIVEYLEDQVSNLS